MATIAVALAAVAMVGGLHVLNHFLEGARTDRSATAAPPERGGADLALEPTSRSPHPVCVPDGASTTGVTCGIPPPSRRVSGGTAYQVLTVAGDRFSVVVPDGLHEGRAVVAVPEAPIGWLGGRPGSKVRLTAEPPARAVARLCDPTLPCRPRALVRTDLATGAIHTTWGLRPRGSGVDVVTIEMGAWVLTFTEGTTEVTEFVARTLRWRLDGGFLLLQSPDPTYPVYDDWAGVRLVVSGNEGSYALTIVPGCELSKKRPPVADEDADRRLRVDRRDGIPGGAWCVAGGFGVEARNVEGATLRRLHQELLVQAN